MGVGEVYVPRVRLVNFHMYERETNTQNYLLSSLTGCIKKKKAVFFELEFCLV